MAEMLDASSSLESTTVGVFRTAATIKGGRRFSFSALVVVGDRHGRVGVGYGKANQVPPAIEKAQKEAKRGMRRFPLLGRTIPHEVTGRFGSCQVRMIPASPGTGVIAGASVRAPLEMLGVQDCLTKAFGSTNSKNLVKAVIDGLGKLKSKEMVQELRGQDLGRTVVEEAVERGEAYMPTRSGEKAKAPVNLVALTSAGVGAGDPVAVADGPAAGPRPRPPTSNQAISRLALRRPRPAAGRAGRAERTKRPHGRSFLIMMIHDITSQVGKYKTRKRVGRGQGSGLGKTSGRGHKGAGSRSGWHRRPGFEGGQMSIIRRIPKRGFTNDAFRTDFHVVNLKVLESRLDDGAAGDPGSAGRAGNHPGLRAAAQDPRRR